ncbi:high mobility group protein HMG-I/HMG-Y-like isoform X4 [Myxocyprinus asiaticus]|uniref:high mobility group protein HMG-I/HMG-Y-like isoform X3 n=1 Tax=Myxocyprinus asiaticus TaxID=70543 RepID=UPI002221A616|nr:high mobility group protein HMG-I/HMG-Y-like isoform X3 [Myxocyprinus asiaticus]XP_051563081.1 high mobility group protein HMG-I/HMG-Y-like isoform X4 [Myxocyprinus asiaticus]
MESEQSVLVNEEEMDMGEDLSDFDKGQIVMARRLGLSISDTARLVGCSRSAVEASGSPTPEKQRVRPKSSRNKGPSKRKASAGGKPKGRPKKEEKVKQAPQDSSEDAEEDEEEEQ